MLVVYNATLTGQPRVTPEATEVRAFAPDEVPSNRPVAVTLLSKSSVTCTVIVAGVPLRAPGTTNMLRIASVGPSGDAEM